MTTYQVQLSCDEFCDDYEIPRIVLQTGDPVEAIRVADQHRDQLHITDILIVESSVTVIPHVTYREESQNVLEISVVNGGWASRARVSAPEVLRLIEGLKAWYTQDN